MTNPVATQIGEIVLNELDHFQRNFNPEGGAAILPTQLALQKEPFVAAVRACHEKDGEEILLICRHFTPKNMRPATNGADFASYLSPYGQIVAKKPGQTHLFEVTLPGERVLRHQSELIWKDEFQPRLLPEGWDAMNNRMEWIGDRMAAASLRKLIQGDLQEPSARTRQVKVELPAQAILDEVQDRIFRLPINHRVLIFGSPGTGKTTVLLKRLSQKTKQEFLSEQEKALFRSGEWSEQDWLLFTPSDLLKGYLKEALAKELLPAGDDHLKVYWTFRKEVLRELGVLKVGNQGVFRVLSAETQLLKRRTPAEYGSLTRAFGEYLNGRIRDHFRERAQNYNNEVRSQLAQLSNEGQELMDKTLARLTELTDDPAVLRNIQESARAARDANKAVRGLLDLFRAAGALQEDAENAGFVQIYLHHKRLADLQNQVRATLRNVPDVPDFRRIRSLASSLAEELERLYNSLSLRQIIELAPRAYARFRGEDNNRERYFSESATPELGVNPGISEPEQDVIFFHLLGWVRDVMPELPNDRNGVPKSICSVLDRMKTNVCIDEATDFSPLEIACMERFAHPRRGGVTLSGDLMQRVTKDGLKNWDDLSELSQPFEHCELTTSYRQSERLFRIAKDLYAHVNQVEPPFRSAYERRETDPPPLAFKSGKGQNAARWLADRVFEIFELCGNTLPTIAMLTPTREDVKPLENELAPLLAESGIEVDAAADGNYLGDAARVRIFPVERIKGLEFEAVFYVGIDRMAAIHKDLIDKYFYVGLSRARSLLGVTFETRFPQRLDSTRDHFATQEAFQG
jgi:hypothetical protein